MSRSKKYRTVDDVVLDLASGTSRKMVMQTKYRFKDKDPAYSSMIEEGVHKYDRLVKLKEVREYHILPQDYLNRQELEEHIGWRNIDKEEQ